MKSKITLIALLLTGSLASAQTMGTMTDPRDGNTYKTVSFKVESEGKGMIWMAENLKYEMAGAYVYNKNSEHARVFGLLYTWEAANNACPSGWHLPSDDEWNILISKWGGENAGEALKGNEGWSDHGNGSNTSGFNALPAGWGVNKGKYYSFYARGTIGSFWTSTEYKEIGEESRGYERRMWNNYSGVESNIGDKDSAFSCRCVKDE